MTILQLVSKSFVKKDQRAPRKRIDAIAKQETEGLIAEQVKKILQTSNQQLILMMRS